MEKAIYAQRFELVDSFEEGTTLTMAGKKIAFLWASDAVYESLRDSCNLVPIPQIYISKHVSMLHRKKYPYGSLIKAM